MKLTTKARYAVTAMLDVAIHQQPSPVAIADISRRQEISQSYLEQLFARLRRQSLVNSVRGPGGGYRLARPALDINVAEIIHAIDEPLDVTKCGGTEKCKNGKRCLTHKVWSDLNTVIFDFLSKVTLQRLIDESEAPEEEIISPTFAQVIHNYGNEQKNETTE